jgi:glycolate oxidase FAD binding subunit
MPHQSADGPGPRKLIRVNIDYWEQITDLLDTVAGKEVLVVPQGAGTRQLAPPPVEKSTLLLVLDRLDRIVGFSPADFFIKCQAGVSLSDLFGKLESAGLFFPFLGPSAVGTVGGMVAGGQLADQSRCYDISRWVPAVTVVLADGRRAAGGAVTFKSVAGYDLPRLFCGSFGTLGVVTDATLRCYPHGSRPYGKDLDPVAVRTPLLAEAYTDSGATAAVRTARKIKQSLDPLGIFPVIDGWN